MAYADPVQKKAAKVPTAHGRPSSQRPRAPRPPWAPLQPRTNSRSAVIQLKAPSEKTAGSIRAPAAAKGPWTSADFVSHYYFGGGRAIDLGDVGLGATFRSAPSVEKAVATFVDAALARKEPTFNFSDKTVTDVTDAIFSVGHSTFFRTVAGVPGICNFSFSIRDQFKDPVSLGIEMGGVPYPINFAWAEKRARIGK